MFHSSDRAFWTLENCRAPSSPNFLLSFLTCPLLFKFLSQQVFSGRLRSPFIGGLFGEDYLFILQR
jgi:hypothetical protein